MQKPRAEHFALTIDNQIYVFGGDEDSSIECLDEVKGEWNLSGKLLEKRLLLSLFRERSRNSVMLTNPFFKTPSHSHALVIRL